jgi:hypothetical protein
LDSAPGAFGHPFIAEVEQDNHEEITLNLNLSIIVHISIVYGQLPPTLQHDDNKYRQAEFIHGYLDNLRQYQQ